jgi:ligand-binding SRPBCC domain-containing protein
MLHKGGFERLTSLLGSADDAPAVCRRLQVETIVPTGLSETFAFFSNAANLERLTPPWINFRILTPPPITMFEGAMIDYNITLYGLPIPWRTRIDVWEPGVRFVDRQVAGPYRWWRHEHLFETTGTGTRVIDRVEYVPRMALFSRWLVGRDVDRIFAFRQRVLAQLLPGGADASA